METYPTRPCSGCGEQVIWTKNTRTGHELDVNLVPVAEGRFRLMPGKGGTVWARSVTPTEKITTAFGGKLYQDHLQTCAKADYLRQKQRAERRYR